MLRARYVVVGLVLAVLLVAVGGMGFVVGQITHVTNEGGAGTAIVVLGKELLKEVGVVHGEERAKKKRIGAWCW